MSGLAMQLAGVTPWVGSTMIGVGVRLGCGYMESGRRRTRCPLPHSQEGGPTKEEAIDSSLGFLRYDYPEAVYSELRQLFRQALYEQQDLTAMAQKLSLQLSTERKIMLGVQLYDLISQAGLKQEQVVQFYSFMSQLGMAAQAIDIVYQLNASEESDPGI